MAHSRTITAPSWVTATNNWCIPIGYRGEFTKGLFTMMWVVSRENKDEADPGVRNYTTLEWTLNPEKAPCGESQLRRALDLGRGS